MNVYVGNSFARHSTHAGPRKRDASQLCERHYHLVTTRRKGLGKASIEAAENGV
ncbi:hypothetical protein AURDEDRAFT_117889 [Auricularia subglabra TFB-10046 SS5]|uniref:Uncharacterized protein n=1 Tax=Auricularia subglabra (strain TFB-10046 / SS5) TaxID=717982 RepID=J0WNG4_AURST|nr:hypothetical protein AURDEDRAFT_117889 [Auricularia subglabra TFB-10046 SS5]